MNCSRSHLCGAEIDLRDDPDSLERIEKELGDPGLDELPAVPAKRKPGPKGMSGGAALPLANNGVSS